MRKKYILSLLVFILSVSNAWGATLYFNGAANGNWANLNNWWTTSGFTTHPLSLPTSSDDVIVSATIDSNSGAPASVNTFVFNGIDFYLDITVTVANGATFNGTTYNNGNVIGNATFSGTPDFVRSYNTGTITGNATFNGTGINYGTINGNGIFNGTSTHDAFGTINGNAFFNDESNQNGTINGNATFDTTYYHTSAPSEGVFIIDNSFTEWSGLISGTVYGGDGLPITSFIFGSTTSNDTVINGNATFNGTGYNNGNVYGNATFNDSSYNLSTIHGDAAVYSPSPNPIGGTVTGTVTYYGYAGAPTITNVTSNTTVNGSYKAGTVIPIDVTFSEAVTSTGNVTVTLDTGDTCTFTVTGATTGTCNYTVGAGDTSSGLTVSSVSGIIKDASLNAMTNFVPATNLAANKAIIIDTTAPSVPTITAPSANSRIISSTSNATGTCETGATVSIANAYLSTNPTTTTCSSSTYSVAISWLDSAPVSTAQTLTFTQTDTASNVSASATVNVDFASQSGSGGGAGSGSGGSTISTPTTTTTPTSTQPVVETPIQTPATPTTTESSVDTAVSPSANTGTQAPTPIDTPVINPSPSVSANPTPSILPLNISPRRNTPANVTRLQEFLNLYEGEMLAITGIYDLATQEAVKRFQMKYASEILTPLGLTEPTGNVGIFTRAKINSMIARDSLEPSVFPVNITPQRNNNPVDVIKLQQFFNTYEGETLLLTGIYDRSTQEAVKRFQVKYASEILTPLGLKNPTVNVGIFMRAKIGEIIERK